jgi:hypothetical protein
MTLVTKLCKCIRPYIWMWHTHTHTHTQRTRDRQTRQKMHICSQTHYKLEKKKENRFFSHFIETQTTILLHFNCIPSPPSNASPPPPTFTPKTESRRKNTYTLLFYQRSNPMKSVLPKKFNKQVLQFFFAKSDLQRVCNRLSHIQQATTMNVTILSTGWNNMAARKLRSTLVCCWSSRSEAVECGSG